MKEFLAKPVTRPPYLAIQRGYIYIFSTILKEERALVRSVLYKYADRTKLLFEGRDFCVVFSYRRCPFFYDPRTGDPVFLHESVWADNGLMLVDPKLHYIVQLELENLFPDFPFFSLDRSTNPFPLAPMCP